MGARTRTVPRRLVASRRCAGGGRDARGVHPPPPRGEGRRARALAPRAARDVQRSRPSPRPAVDRDRLPRSRPGARGPALFRRTRTGIPLAPCRSSPSTTARSPSRVANVCARSSRTRTSATPSRRRRSRSASSACSTARRSVTTSRPRTSSVCSSGAASSSRPERSGRRAGPAGARRPSFASASAASR